MPDYIFLNSNGQEVDAEVFEAPVQARAYAEHLAVTRRHPVTYAEVIEYRVQPTCCLCPITRPRPATNLAGDWEVCDDCFNAITEPSPEELLEFDLAEEVV